MDDIPEFLRRPVTTRPAPSTDLPGIILPPAERPAGAKWGNAERWEVKVPGGGVKGAMDWSPLAPGTRLVWAVIGTKWVHLRDSEAYARVPRKDWEMVATCGRRIDAGPPRAPFQNDFDMVWSDRR